MKDINFERAGMLLHIYEKAQLLGANGSSISGEVGEELKAINEDCRQNALERANDRAKAEAQRVAVQQASLKAAKADDDEEVEEFGEDDGAPIERRS